MFHFFIQQRACDAGFAASMNGWGPQMDDLLSPKVSPHEI